MKWMHVTCVRGLRSSTTLACSLEISPPPPPPPPPLPPPLHAAPSARWPAPAPLHPPLPPPLSPPSTSIWPTTPGTATTCPPRTRRLGALPVRVPLRGPPCPRARTSPRGASVLPAGAPWRGETFRFHSSLPYRAHTGGSSRVPVPVSLLPLWRNTTALISWVPPSSSPSSSSPSSPSSSGRSTDAAPRAGRPGACSPARERGYAPLQ
ncbi:hypothetical protein EYF80_056388 [Liparis tanakae]|uniref:Uncharacterized protein n=1 Tax=Liparis tanakae TaxID=230148 RepID=A0A4Z2EYL4_9TELE|nr:hypothetical protein EYF80_056388 [Liparis tanakae]